MLGLQNAQDDSVSASYLACVRLVADGIDAHALTQAIARGPLHRLGVVQSALYIPADNSHPGRGSSLVLAGHYNEPGIDSAPRSLALHVTHPACRAFQSQEVVDWPMMEIADEFPLMSGYGDQLRERGYELTSCRMLALPVDYQSVTHGVLTLQATNLPGSWRWADAELMRGTVSLVAVWLRMTQATNLLQASGILSPGRAGRNVRLSERQVAVLQALRDGKSNTFIAATLGFSISTVKQDIRALQVMLGARNRHEVVQRALRVGLLSVE